MSQHGRLNTDYNSDYSWATMGKSVPALSAFHTDHPLMKNIPVTVNQTDLGNQYSLKITFIYLNIKIFIYIL